MKKIAPEIIESFNSALAKLTGHSRREYAAELCEKFFDSSASKMERYLNVSRKMVELGMHERRSGIRCHELFSMRGAKKKEVTYPDLSFEIEQIIKDQSQVDPQFRTQRCYVKVSASYIRRELIFQKGYQLSDFCERSINNILNRMGYTLKKVLKIKPLKKIAQTDQIFANVWAQHAKAENDPRILRISIDTKAKVKVGNLSRGGYSRMLNAPIADDHDQQWDAVLVPLGIQEINTDDLYLIFGNSKETSDFIVDGLEMWWSTRQFNEAQFDSLMIDLDNGKSVASNTKLFIKRITAFAQKIGMPIQLVYYPPYHSKYNSVERVGAALENYWSPIILDSVKNTLKVARQMTYKGINPIVKFIDKVYHKGVKVAVKEVKELEEN